MVTPRQERAAKRSRPRVTTTTRTVGTQTNLTVFAGSKSEMKNRVTPISYSSQSANNTICNGITQGTAIDQRVGSSVKIHRIEGHLRSVGDQSIRATLYVPKVGAATSLAGNLTGQVDLNDYWVIKDWWLHAGTSPCNRGSFFSHKFPLGVVSKYAIGSTAAAGDFRANLIQLRLQTPASDTIQGYIRVWFTDP